MGRKRKGEDGRGRVGRINKWIGRWIEKECVGRKRKRKKEEIVNGWKERMGRKKGRRMNC